MCCVVFGRVIVVSKSTIAVVADVYGDCTHHVVFLKVTVVESC